MTLPTAPTAITARSARSGPFTSGKSGNIAASNTVPAITVVRMPSRWASGSTRGRSRNRPVDCVVTEVTHGMVAGKGDVQKGSAP